MSCKAYNNTNILYDDLYHFTLDFLPAYSPDYKLYGVQKLLFTKAWRHYDSIWNRINNRQYGDVSTTQQNNGGTSKS